MAFSNDAPHEPRTRLDALLSPILDGLEGSAAWPPDWELLNNVDYLYRERHLLVRDADVERVMAITPSERIQHDDNLRGVTLLRLTEDETRSVEEVCTAVDRTFGKGMATPDHIFHLGPTTEPEEVSSSAPPDPDVSTEQGDGDGVLVSVLDSGWLGRCRCAALLAGGRDRPDRGSVRR